MSFEIRVTSMAGETFTVNVEASNTIDNVKDMIHDLEGIAQRVVQARLSMRKGKFDPTPTPTNCKYCDFETVCEARKTQREFNAARRRPKEEKPKEAAGPDGFGDLIR